MAQTPDLGGLNRWQGKALHIQGEMADKTDNDRSHVAVVSVPLLPLNEEIGTTTTTKMDRLFKKSWQCLSLKKILNKYKISSQLRTATLVNI